MVRKEGLVLGRRNCPLYQRINKVDVYGRKKVKLSMSTSKIKLTTSSALLSVSLLPLASQNIHAYIDPGTGSLIIQVLIASFVGALFLLKVYWRKVKAFLNNLFSKTRKGNG